MTADRNWTRCSTELPPNGKLVRTMSENGQVQNLKRRDRLWFVEDGSMYVYYTPTHWQEIA